jgi:hypothetical protein
MRRTLRLPDVAGAGASGFRSRASCSADSCQRNKNRLEVTESEQSVLASDGISQAFLAYTRDGSNRCHSCQAAEILRVCPENRNYPEPIEVFQSNLMLSRYRLWSAFTMCGLRGNDGSPVR